MQAFLLWLGLTTIIYLFLLVLFASLKIEFPGFLHVTVSVLSSGYLVYRFLAPRLG
jgi:membrane protein implicated in regulation of membrane protease activity